MNSRHIKYGQVSESEIPRNSHAESHSHIRQSPYQHARIINKDQTPNGYEVSCEAHSPNFVENGPFYVW
jgi:hypothetical protein